MKRTLHVEINVGADREYMADFFVLTTLCAIENLEQYGFSFSAREVENLAASRRAGPLCATWTRVRKPKMCAHLSCWKIAGCAL